MATCESCKREMLSADGCDPIPVIVGEIKYLPIPYGSETRFGEGWCESMPEDKRCHDCNAKKGKYHHPGCDMEQCPKCNCQLIGCGCLGETAVAEAL